MSAKNVYRASTTTKTLASSKTSARKQEGSISSMHEVDLLWRGDHRLEESIICFQSFLEKDLRAAKNVHMQQRDVEVPSLLAHALHETTTRERRALPFPCNLALKLFPCMQSPSRRR